MQDQVREVAERGGGGVNGFSDMCKDCKHFEPCDVPKEATVHDYPTQKKDGFCHKIFPRGYVGAGKPGGYVYSRKAACFQFEIGGNT